MATEAHTFEIDGMTGDECVRKVRSALEAVDGLTVDSVGVGTAQIHCEGSVCDKACQAIDAAGYQAQERKQDMSKNPNQNMNSDQGRNQNQGQTQKMGSNQNTEQSFGRDGRGSEQSKSRSDQSSKAPGSSAGLGQSKNRSESDQDQSQSHDKSKVSSGQGSMNASQAKENMISEGGGNAQNKSRDNKGKPDDQSRSQK